MVKYLGGCSRNNLPFMLLRCNPCVLFTFHFRILLLSPVFIIVEHPSNLISEYVLRCDSVRNSVVGCWILVLRKLHQILPCPFYPELPQIIITEVPQPCAKFIGSLPTAYPCVREIGCDVSVLIVPRPSFPRPLSRVHASAPVLCVFICLVHCFEDCLSFTSRHKEGIDHRIFLEQFNTVFIASLSVFLSFPT